MEKQPHKEYRDEIAGKLKEVRNSDPENPEIAKAKAQGYLEAKQETGEFIESSQRHKDEIIENKFLKDKEDIKKRIENGEIDLNSIFEKKEDFLSNEEWSILHEVVSEKEAKLSSVRTYKPTLGIKRGASDGGIDAWHEETRQYEIELHNEEEEIEHLKKAKKFIEQMKLESRRDFKDKISKYSSYLDELEEIDKNNDGVFSDIGNYHYSGAEYVPGKSEEELDRMIGRVKKFVQEDPHSLDVACSIVENTIDLYQLAVSNKTKFKAFIWPNRAIAAFGYLGDSRFDDLYKNLNNWKNEYSKLS